MESGCSDGSKACGLSRLNSNGSTLLPANPRALRALRQPCNKAIARAAAKRKTAKTTGGSLNTDRDGSVQYDERIFCPYGETASLTRIGGRGRILLRLANLTECNSRGMPVSAAFGRPSSPGSEHLAAEPHSFSPPRSQLSATHKSRRSTGSATGPHRHPAHVEQSSWSGPRPSVTHHHRVRRSLQKKASRHGST